MRKRRRGKRETLTALLACAGLDRKVKSLETIGIGTAGLNARGPRDEDGTHHRLLLDDGSSYIYREYATTRRSADFFRLKEAGFFKSLGAAGLPTPKVLGGIEGSGEVGGDPPALLLTDGGGRPLEEVFLEVSGRSRSQLWATVGKLLRQLHSTDISVAGVWARPDLQETGTRFVLDLSKQLRKLKAYHPELVSALDALGSLRPDLREYLNARPPAIRFGEGYYLPGMLLQRSSKGWTCGSWLSLGYYTAVGDPLRDVVAIDVIHREFTGDPLPASFFKAYGKRPDPVCQLIYEAYPHVGRGSAYVRPDSRVNTRNGPGPPPHSTAVRALHDLPKTVDELQALLG